MTLTAEQQPYSRAGSPGAVAAGAYNTPLPFSAPLDANSAQMALDAYNSMKADTPGFDASASSVYVASGGDSTYTVTASGIGGSTTIKAPAGMIAGPPADSPLEMFDNVTAPGAYKQVRCFGVTSINDGAKTIDCINLGITSYGPASDGIMTTGVGTGCDLAIACGLLRGTDLTIGPLTHAIRVTGPNYIKPTFRAPAQKSDQGGLGARDPTNPAHGKAGALEMGVRFRLKSSVNPDTRVAWNPDGASAAVMAKRTAALRAVCRALQTYGFVISDGSGSADGYNFELELDTATYGGTADWNSIIGQRPGFAQFYGWLFRDHTTGGGPDANGGIPWDQLEVVASGTPTLPDITTGSSSAIGDTTATVDMDFNSRYDTGVAYFDYGLTTSYGYQSAPPVPVTGLNTSQHISKGLTALIPGTLYHYRAVFVGTRMGTYVGADQTFTTTSTAPPPVVTPKRTVRRHRHGGRAR